MHFQPLATGVQSRPKSVLMLVARDWLAIELRMSRSRSASGRKALFGMLKHIARAGRMVVSAFSTLSSSSGMPKIFAYSSHPPLVCAPCGKTGATTLPSTHRYFFICSHSSGLVLLSDGTDAWRTSGPPADCPSPPLTDDASSAAGLGSSWWLYCGCDSRQRRSASSSVSDATSPYDTPGRPCGACDDEPRSDAAEDGRDGGARSRARLASAACCRCENSSIVSCSGGPSSGSIIADGLGCSANKTASSTSASSAAPAPPLASASRASSSNKSWSRSPSSHMYPTTKLELDG